MPRKLIKSLKFAQAGAHHALRTQRNLWIHMSFGVVVFVLGVVLKVSPLELAALSMAVFFVIVAEIFNTAIEELVNILSPEHRVEAALAKNVAAAAVLLAAAAAIMVGCLILLPRIM
ncbi:MAG: diacylglycerol kinase family protein [bacterium]